MANGVTTFETMGEAVQRLIVEPIQASEVVDDAREEYDVDAIADEAIVMVSAPGRAPYFEQGVSVEEFWEIVERNML